MLSLIQQADPNASAQTKAADLAMLTAIEQRIDAEFKGSPDQLLQLRVTIGDAYRTAAKRRRPPRVPARRRRSNTASSEGPFAAVASPRARGRLQRDRFLGAANDLAQAIDILRTKGADGAGILIDALLIQNMLGRRFHIPERMSLERDGSGPPGNARARNPSLRRRQP